MQAAGRCAQEGGVCVEQRGTWEEEHTGTPGWGPAHTGMGKLAIVTGTDAVT
jgi:hypothetical protein